MNNPTAPQYQQPNTPQQAPSDKEFDVQIVYTDTPMIADGCLYDDDPNNAPFPDFYANDLAGWIRIPSPK